MAVTWKTVRVFISSTFRDMHAERDYLVRVVFPALRERLLPYRIHLDDIECLGSFIEFEYVVGDESRVEDAEELLECLKQHFGIQEEDLVATSYSDLLIEAANRSP